jgi:fumarate reductase subunit D
MKINSRNESHWAVGTYIDLILAAVGMQIVFFITVIWVGTIGTEFFNLNLDEILYTMRIQLGLGWMMCIIAGLGFSTLPLIYDVPTFEKSVMRTYVAMNIFGQLAIMIGIMSGNLSIYHTLATIGITLLCTSLVCLGPAAMTIFKSKKTVGDKIGPFSYAIGVMMPFLGIITLICWVARDEFPEALDFSESLILDFFIPLIAATMIISHFNRRLDWNLIEPRNIGKVFGIYTVLLLLSIISEPLSERGDISVRVTAVLHFLPYFFIFIMMNPKKLLSFIKQKKPYNKMVFTALLWIPFVGFAAYIEAMESFKTTNAMNSYYRWIMVFGVAFQALWGFAEYLHEDHKKLSIHRRKTKWLIYSTINLATIITFYSMIINWTENEVADAYPRIAIAIYALSYILILIYWIKEVFFSLGDWHKTPMFYDQYLAYPKQGSGFEPE